MQLSKKELMDFTNDIDLYNSLLEASLKMTDKTLGGFLKESSQNIDLAYDALLDSLEKIIKRIDDGTYTSKEAETIEHHKNQFKLYVKLSIKNYLVDRSRRWGSDPETKVPAARARVETPSDTNFEDHLDKIHLGIFTRTSKSTFKEGALEELISKAKLTEDEKWILNIRSSDMKLSKCVGREKLLPIDNNLVLSTCRDLENNKPKSKQRLEINCTCRFVEMSFSEIEEKYGGKADTYQKRFNKALNKLRAIAVNS